jgi:hypothetical protein
MYFYFSYGVANSSPLRWRRGQYRIATSARASDAIVTYFICPKLRRRRTINGIGLLSPIGLLVIRSLASYQQAPYLVYRSLRYGGAPARSVILHKRVGERLGCSVPLVPQENTVGSVILRRGQQAPYLHISEVHGVCNCYHMYHRALRRRSRSRTSQKKRTDSETPTNPRSCAGAARVET